MIAPHCDTSAMARALRQVLLDSQLRMRLANAGKMDAQHLTLDHMVANFVGGIEGALHASR